MPASKFNLNRINEALLNRLPSDADIHARLCAHRFNKMPMIRFSKFRHIYGKVGRKEECFEGLKISKITHDGNICAVNTKFIAVVVESAGGGVFTVLPLNQTGRVTINYPKINGHSGPVTDIKWNPFDDNIIASCSDDTTIKLWRIPDSGLADSMTDCLLNLQGHLKRVGHLEWHPTATDILLSAGNDHKCIIWNVATAMIARIISVHPDNILSLAWNRDGSYFATTCKDKKIRVIDPRSEHVVAQGEGHLGPKTSKVIFLDKRRLLTTGFSRLSERQFAIWDLGDMGRPLKLENLDISSGVLTPYFDFDTKVLFIAGKGDGNIRYFEVVEEAPFVHYLCQFLSSLPQGGLAQIPKKGVDPQKCEIVRFYKLHTTKDIIEPMSMIVPRKSEMFQEDLYPPTSGLMSSVTGEEWLNGARSAPVLVPFKEIIPNPPMPGRRAITKEPDACESGMPNSVRPDAYAEIRRCVPGSIRNIMRLSGTEFEFFLQKQAECQKLNDNYQTTSEQRKSFSKTEHDKLSPEMLDNQKRVSVNNNFSQSDDNIPKSEDDLRKAFVVHSNEIKLLKDRLGAKDSRIQELEEELNALKMIKNSINNG